MKVIWNEFMFVIKNSKGKAACFHRRLISLTFLRGEIESGYSSIQNILYRRIVCKVCTVSKRTRKNIKKN